MSSKNSQIIQEIGDFELFCSENAYEFRILSIQYIDKTFQIIKDSYKGIKNKHIFAIPNYQEVERRFTTGLTIGAFWEGELIGIRMISFTKSNEDLRCNFASIISSAGKMELICVMENHRCKKVAQCLNKIALSIFSRCGYQYAFATASPYNLSSIICLFKSAFKIVDLTFMYHGVLRYTFIYGLNLKNTDKKNKKKVLKNFDIDGQKTLLNDGYVGDGFSKINTNEVDIVYKKQAK